MRKSLILLRIVNLVFFLIFTGTSWGANNISWFCRLTGTGHRVFFPGSWHGNHAKNSSSTSKYVRNPAAAWILVLLLALQMLQNNSANSVVADNFQLYLHQACVTKKRHQKTHKTIFQNYYDFLHDHVWLLHTCVQVSGCLKFIYYLSNKMYALTVTDNKKYYRS